VDELGRDQDAFRFPSFPDRAAPGGSLHDLVARSVAVLALAVTAAYLTWRAVATIDLAAWWVLEAPGQTVAVRCAVRSRLDEADGSQTVGVEFLAGSGPAIGTLTHLLFNAGVGLELVPEPERVLAGAVA
jgi:hypothetical protein